MQTEARLPRALSTDLPGSLLQGSSHTDTRTQPGWMQLATSSPARSAPSGRAAQPGAPRSGCVLCSLSPQLFPFPHRKPHPRPPSSISRRGLHAYRRPCVLKGFEQGGCGQDAASPTTPAPGPPGALSTHPPTSPRNPKGRPRPRLQLRGGCGPSLAAGRSSRRPAPLGASPAHPTNGPAVAPALTHPEEGGGRGGNTRPRSGHAPFAQATPIVRRLHPLTHRPYPRGGATLKASAHAPARFP